ncbi:MAG: dethiobiotin synthase [Pseudomonadota bacterium]
MSQTLFVTGTDTDAGKTVVSAALLRGLRARGIAACGFKPVASGAIATPQGLASEDALALQAASAPGAALAEINPVLFTPAIAPHLAAAACGEPIDPALLVRAHASLAARYPVIVAEGAGGWLTPLGNNLLLGDWVAQQGWPVLLVVRIRLGCLNHALLTAESIAARGLRLAGWVASLAPPVPDEAAAMIETLTVRLGAPLWRQQGLADAPAEAIQTLFRR